MAEDIRRPSRSGLNTARWLPLRANEGGKAAGGALQEGWNRVRKDDTSLAVEILQGIFCMQIRIGAAKTQAWKYACRSMQGGKRDDGKEEMGRIV